MKGEKIKIGIVDDHKVFRIGLESILEEHNELDVIFHASNGEELLEKLKSEDVDLIFLDIKMPVLNGIDVLKEIRKTNGSLRIIMLTMHDEDNYIHKVFKEQANGYLLKDTEPDEIYLAIQACMTSGSYYSEKVNSVLLKTLFGAKKIAQGYKGALIEFNEKEESIIQLLAKQNTTPQIAKILNLNPRAIEVSRKSMIEKTGSKNTIGLILYSMRHGIIDFD